MADDCKNEALVVFARIPELGKVKTRMHERLTAADTLALYQAMLQTWLFRLAPILSERRGFLFFQGSGAWPFALDRRWRLVRQTGADLGERMHAAFRSVHGDTTTRVIIVGVDSPDIDLEWLQSGFESLKVRDFVVGPCSDGGYYCIGSRLVEAAPFTNIKWGEAEVFENTLTKLRNTSLTYALLPTWHDTDYPADLQRFYESPSAERIAGTPLAEWLHRKRSLILKAEA